MRKSVMALSAILLATGATGALAARLSTPTHSRVMERAQTEMQTETPAEFCRWHGADTNYDMYCAPYND
ncbi:hypothetical protein [Hyphomicrobium sp. DY-1]|uniref:hypothetical protein n=1 Tax=Hyphomicrobium sp. DY-1 TaxID=3075650 RepID=UPI0039C3E275